MAQPALAVGTSLVQSVRRAILQITDTPPYCPVCFHIASEKILERFHAYTLHECTGCHLRFWEPRKMPSPRWYSAMYGQRNQRLLPLEPGHRFFLADQLAPRCGRLLDVGCGTGNFLIAASLAGYAVSGIELDPAAAALAERYCPRARVFPVPLESFRSCYPNEVFDIVSFFEVFEHQADPAAFLAEIRACLRPRGFIVLSVPNRNRWQTGIDALDYPPNHFLRWDAESLSIVLRAHGFSVMSMKQERASVSYTAAQLNTMLRSGVSRSLAPELPAWFRDEIQEDLTVKEERNAAGLSRRTRLVQLLGRMKHRAYFPLALAVFPYVRWRRFVGSYLYCLARKLD